MAAELKQSRYVGWLEREEETWVQFAGVERHVCGSRARLGMGVLRTDVEEAGAGNRGVEDSCGGDTTSLGV